MYTKRVQEVLDKVLKRYVRILTDGIENNIFQTDGSNVNVYEFLRYDNDDKKCVISGPIHPHHQSCLVCRGDSSLDPILHVSKNFVVPEVGCPVICCGLEIGTYLNGEVGDVISYQNKITEFRLEVCFENKDFGSRMVKLENVQIATDLPGKGEVQYGEGWEEPGNLWGENGIREEPYEEVNVVERERRSTMRLLSLCADCDEYMGANIDAILFSVNIFF
jgi:hypothetical protein